jgi:Ca2+-binding RTX toxin-like protein
VGADTVTTGDGVDRVMGDNGEFNFDANGLLESFASTYPALGGDDTLAVGDGANIVVGGFGNDTIVTGADADIVLGDNGEVTYTPGTEFVAQARTTDVENATGGNDIIIADEGDNLILAGVGADTVTTGDGTDRVMGDNGEFNFDANGLLESFASADPTLGGDDTLAVGDGANIVVGGFGNDTIVTGADADIVLGDNGEVTYTPGTTDLLQARSTDLDNATGGNDTIVGGDGDNVILAGVGADTVTAGNGADIVLGDNGQVDWMPNGQYSQFQTTDLTLGGNDDIRVGDGDNIVLGGFGSDVIETGVGEDLILGDNGLFQYTPDANGDAVLTEARTTDTTPDTGAGDVIVAGGGDGGNIVLAGPGGDRVNQDPRPGTNDPAGATSTGRDIVIGDNGFVNWDTNEDLAQFGSSEPELGGDDLINVGDGANIVVGGFGNDTIVTGADADIVLGDDGQVDYVGGDNDPADIDLITSTSTTAGGGADNITTQGGDDVVIGGRSGDTIVAGAGDDVVFGDNAQVTSTDAGTRLETTDTVAETGGDDTIDAGDGDNQVFGGVGNDTVTTGSGADIVIGDNGTIVNNPDGTLREASTGDPLLGGDDTIATGDGTDIAFGGAGNDTVTSAGGDDFLFGDGGRVTVNGNQVVITSIDVAFGGDDTLDGGAGLDILVGGQGRDLLFGSFSEDLLFGSFAAIILTDGIVSKIVTDLNDFISKALFSSFNALPDSGAGTVDALRSLLGLLLAESQFQNALLDAAMFQKLFDSTVDSASDETTHGAVERDADGTTPPEEGEVPAGEPEEGPAAAVPLAPVPAGQPGLPLRLATPVPARPQADEEDERGGNALAAALGVAGLLAVQRSRERRLHS